MAGWRRWARRKAGDRSGSGDREHLEEFLRTRKGVEAFVEPATSVTQTTVLLVAHDGEWTRRRVPNPQTVFSWAKAKGVPCYDAGLVGYPQRMRDWTARQRRAED